MEVPLRSCGSMASANVAAPGPYCPFKKVSSSVNEPAFFVGYVSAGIVAAAAVAAAAAAACHGTAVCS